MAHLLTKHTTIALMVLSSSIIMVSIHAGDDDWEDMSASTVSTSDIPDASARRDALRVKLSTQVPQKSILSTNSTPLKITNKQLLLTAGQLIQSDITQYINHFSDDAPAGLLAKQLVDNKKVACDQIGTALESEALAHEFIPQISGTGKAQYPEEAKKLCVMRTRLKGEIDFQLGIHSYAKVAQQLIGQRSFPRFPTLKKHLLNALESIDSSLPELVNIILNITIEEIGKQSSILLDANAPIQSLCATIMNIAVFALEIAADENHSYGFAMQCEAFAAKLLYELYVKTVAEHQKIFSTKLYEAGISEERVHLLVKKYSQDGTPVAQASWWCMLL